MNRHHLLVKLKRISVKQQVRRRCWTEICRKVDGKTKETPMWDPYTSSCFQLFLQDEQPVGGRLLLLGQQGLDETNRDTKIPA